MGPHIMLLQHRGDFAGKKRLGRGAFGTTLSTTRPNDKIQPMADAKAPVTPVPSNDLLLFGFDITRLNPKHRFAFLAFGSLFCALTFAALQEKVFLVEGMRHQAGCTTSINHDVPMYVQASSILVL